MNRLNKESKGWNENEMTVCKSSVESEKKKKVKVRMRKNKKKEIRRKK